MMQESEGITSCPGVVHRVFSVFARGCNEIHHNRVVECYDGVLWCISDEWREWNVVPDFPFRWYISQAVHCWRYVRQITFHPPTPPQLTKFYETPLHYEVYTPFANLHSGPIQGALRFLSELVHRYRCSLRKWTMEQPNEPINRTIASRSIWKLFTTKAALALTCYDGWLSCRWNGLRRRPSRLLQLAWWPGCGWLSSAAMGAKVFSRTLLWLVFFFFFADIFYSIGNGLAIFINLMLKTAVGIAYTQYLWRQLRNLSLSVSSINDAFGMETNIFSLLNWDLFSKMPLVVTLGILLWWVLHYNRAVLPN